MRFRNLWFYCVYKCRKRSVGGGNLKTENGHFERNRNGKEKIRIKNNNNSSLKTADMALKMFNFVLIIKSWVKVKELLKVFVTLKCASGLQSADHTFPYLLWPCVADVQVI